MSVTLIRACMAFGVVVVVGVGDKVKSTFTAYSSDSIRQLSIGRVRSFRGKRPYGR